MSGEDNDFDIAKRMSDLLKGVGKDRQQKILRWVAENFDVVMVIPPSSGTANPPTPVTPPSPGSSGQPGRAVDIRSFVEAKNPKSDNQFAAVVAYYYAFEAPSDERRDMITADLLRDAARLAQRKRLGTPSMTLAHAKSRGYLDAVDRGQYRINSVGENLVAMALPSSTGVSDLPRKVSPRRRSAKTKATSSKKATAKKKP